MAQRQKRGKNGAKISQFSDVFSTIAQPVIEHEEKNSLCGAAHTILNHMRADRIVKHLNSRWIDDPTIDDPTKTPEFKNVFSFDVYLRRVYRIVFVLSIAFRYDFDCLKCTATCNVLYYKLYLY